MWCTGSAAGDGNRRKCVDLFYLAVTVTVTAANGATGSEDVCVMRVFAIWHARSPCDAVGQCLQVVLDILLLLSINTHGSL